MQIDLSPALWLALIRCDKLTNLALIQGNGFCLLYPGAWILFLIECLLLLLLDNETRVVLPQINNDCMSSYINANYVHVSHI